MGENRLRVSVFASDWFGLFLLDELLRGQYRGQVTVVGIATEDPDQPHCKAERRFWSMVPASQ